MVRKITAAMAAVLCLMSTLASAGPVQPKRPAKTHWHGYGFLPGYPPGPSEYRYQNYWYGGPQFYRGRWNGGGFGPCYTKTPIGPIYNCG